MPAIPACVDGGMSSFKFWSFHTNKWMPTPDEWSMALSLVQPEEKRRILRFRFKVDQKRALIGRLMIRASVVAHTKRPYAAIKLMRTKRNKPMLVPDARHAQCEFNISHHGDWVVLASHPSRVVGVDVMRYEQPRGVTSVPSYFDLMKHCFTKDEWETINAPKTDALKLRQFYRHWALKESFIKATGEGLGLELTRVNFTTVVVGRSRADATATLDNKLLRQWRFVVFDLDPLHCVAVAAKSVDVTSKLARQLCPRFRTMSFQDLISAAAPRCCMPPDEKAAKVVMAKSMSMSPTRSDTSGASVRIHTLSSSTF